MGNQASVISSTSLQLSPADQMALARARNSLVGNDLTAPLAPDFRHRLVQFLIATNDRMTAATRPDIEAEIAVLMLAFYTARRTSPTEAKAMMQIYSEVLVDQPLWAIRAGFAKIKAGEVEGASLDFPPAAPRLRRVVVEATYSLLLERHKVQKVLAAREAQPDNPEMAKRSAEIIKAGFKELIQELENNNKSPGCPR